GHMPLSIVVFYSDFALTAMSVYRGSRYLLQSGGAGVLEDHVGAFLANHDRGRVGYAARHLRHDRGVCNAQPLDAVDLEAGIDDRIGPAAHAAGADRMQVG